MWEYYLALPWDELGHAGPHGRDFPTLNTGMGSTGMSPVVARLVQDSDPKYPLMYLIDSGIVELLGL
jgi:hypothetical protein